MNQILVTKPTKKRKTGNMSTVIVFFAISIIIFGLCLVTSGSYAMYKSLASNTKNNSSNTSNNVTNNNIQNNTVQNSNEEIQINLSVDETNMKATVTGKREISFVTYKWDDEEETREDINNTYGEVIIEIPGGEHVLTVTAVDDKNNTKTKEQQVTGVTKPKLEVVKENNEIVINAEDEIGLDKIEFIINDQGYRVRAEGAKTMQYRYELPEGDKTIEVTVYNTNGVTETFNALW